MDEQKCGVMGSLERLKERHGGGRLQSWVIGNNSTRKASGGVVVHKKPMLAYASSWQEPSDKSCHSSGFRPENENPS